MNRAIVTDIALIETAALLEQRVVTPSTLFAANSIAQAVIFHDEVILGITGLVGMSHDGIDFIADKLDRSVARRPTIGEFSNEIDDGSTYATLLHWVAADQTTANSAADVEVAHFSVVQDFLRARRLADITGESSLLDDFGVRGGRRGDIANQRLFSTFNADVVSRGGQPLSPNDLITVRDMAWLAAAGYTLSRALKVDVYHALIERPFYAGQLRKPQGPLELVRRASAALEVEEAWFKDVRVPPFFGMILSEPTFSVRDFWSLLLQARMRHSDFRAAISTFEMAFRNARTKGEQRDILDDHTRAWDALLERRDYFARERILYVIADAAKTLGKSLLDRLVELQRFEHATGKVGGLVKLWDTMRQIAPDENVRELLGSHFGSAPSDAHWAKVGHIVKAVNSAAGLSEP
jgi:hypothetical protein